jgi:hypothetical protein
MSEQKNLNFTLELEGWWGDESVLIDPACVLYKFKFDVITALLENNFINHTDLDRRNKVAHIKITNKKMPRDKTKFEFYQKKNITITFSDIIVNRDYIGINIPKIDQSSPSEVHMTIFFKKNINDKKQDILKVINEVFDKYSKLEK